MNTCEHEFRPMENEETRTDSGHTMIINNGGREKCVKCGRVQWQKDARG